MPTTSAFLPAVTVAHRRVLRCGGVTNQRIRTAVRTGRWQEPVRGVVVGNGGGLTQRQNALHGAGLVLLRFPVRRLRGDGPACGRELAALVA